MKHILRIYKSIFKWTPGAATFSVCHRLYDAFVPDMLCLFWRCSGSSCGAASVLAYSDVSFTYPNGAEQALKSLNLTIRRGEKIAILGENGSGKTTLSKVLLRLYPPQSGRVLYDGAPVSDYAKGSSQRFINSIG